MFIAEEDVETSLLGPRKRRHLFIVEPLSSVSVADLVASSRGAVLSESMVKTILRGLLRAVRVLHEIGQAAGHLAPETIVVSVAPDALAGPLSIGEVRLRVPDLGVDLSAPLRSRSRSYLPPEALLGHGSEDWRSALARAADMWAVGAIAAELVVGLALFDASDPAEQLFQIFRAIGFPAREQALYLGEAYDALAAAVPLDRVAWATLVPSLSAAGQSFLTRCLAFSPDARATVNDALASEYLQLASRVDAGSGRRRDATGAAHVGGGRVLSSSLIYAPLALSVRESEREASSEHSASDLVLGWRSPREAQLAAELDAVDGALEGLQGRSAARRQLRSAAWQPQDLEPPRRAASLRPWDVRGFPDETGSERAEARGERVSSASDRGGRGESWTQAREGGGGEQVALGGDPYAREGENDRATASRESYAREGGGGERVAVGDGGLRARESGVRTERRKSHAHENGSGSERFGDSDAREGASAAGRRSWARESGGDQAAAKASSWAHELWRREASERDARLAREAAAAREEAAIAREEAARAREPRDEAERWRLAAREPSASTSVSVETAALARQVAELQQRADELREQLVHLERSTSVASAASAASATAPAPAAAAFAAAPALAPAAAAVPAAVAPRELHVLEAQLADLVRHVHAQRDALAADAIGDSVTSVAPWAPAAQARVTPPLPPPVRTPAPPPSDVLAFQAADVAAAPQALVISCEQLANMSVASAGAASAGAASLGWLVCYELGGAEQPVASALFSPARAVRVAHTAAFDMDSATLRDVCAGAARLLVYAMPRARGPASDGRELVCHVTVDLRPLLCGLAALDGWYVCIDAAGNACGQARVAARPRRPIEREAAVAAKTSVAATAVASVGRTPASGLASDWRLREDTAWAAPVREDWSPYSERARPRLSAETAAAMPQSEPQSPPRDDTDEAAAPGSALFARYLEGLAARRTGDAPLHSADAAVAAAVRPAAAAASGEIAALRRLQHELRQLATVSSRETDLS